MTDSEKLDLILSKIEKLDSLEKDIHSLKRQIMKSTAELKAMDEMIIVKVLHSFYWMEGMSMATS